MSDWRFSSVPSGSCRRHQASPPHDGLSPSLVHRPRWPRRKATHLLHVSGACLAWQATGPPFYPSPHAFHPCPRFLRMPYRHILCDLLLPVPIGHLLTGVMREATYRPFMSWAERSMAENAGTPCLHRPFSVRQSWTNLSASCSRISKGCTHPFLRPLKLIFRLISALVQRLCTNQHESCSARRHHPCP